MPKVKTVDSYISAFPKPVQVMLKQLRAAIKSSAPKAEEKLSYGMPYYGYLGRLVYFAAFTNHISLFIMGKSQTSYLAEQKKYRQTKATLHFPIGSKIPIALVKKLVEVRLKEIDAKMKRKVGITLP